MRHRPHETACLGCHQPIGYGKKRVWAIDTTKAISSRSPLGNFLGRLLPRFVTAALLLIPFASFSRGSQAQPRPAQPTPSNTAQQSRAEDTQAPRPAQFVDQTIPLPLIADRAEQLDRLLEEINNQLIPKSILLESGRKAAAEAAEMRRRSLQSRELCR